jgi:hypothetical protein
MTQDGQKIDWKKILLENRDSYTCDDSVHGDSDARYQSEFESNSQRMAKWVPSVAVDRREDAERQRNVFDAISLYWRVDAPIPPERRISTLNHTFPRLPKYLDQAFFTSESQSGSFSAENGQCLSGH